MRLLTGLIALLFVMNAIGQVRENIKQKNGSVVSTPSKPKSNIRK